MIHYGNPQHADYFEDNPMTKTESNEAFLNGVTAWLKRRGLVTADVARLLALAERGAAIPDARQQAIITELVEALKSIADDLTCNDSDLSSNASGARETARAAIAKATS
jgi:hypothetical protein